MNDSVEKITKQARENFETGNFSKAIFFAKKVVRHSEADEKQKGSARDILKTAGYDYYVFGAFALTFLLLLFLVFRYVF